jgi:hypothetical protein
MFKVHSIRDNRHFSARGERLEGSRIVGRGRQHRIEPMQQLGFIAAGAVELERRQAAMGQTVARAKRPFLEQ